MNNKLLLLSGILLATILSCVISPAVNAQISHGGSPINWGEETSQTSFEIKSMPNVDLTILAEEDAVTDQYKEAPWRFGVEREVEYNLENSGTWTFEEGMHVWRLGVHCPEAINVSFMLSTFNLPTEATLYIYNSDRTAYLGSFTQANNKEWGGLSLGVLDGSRMILEYHESPASHGLGSIEIGTVVHGYRSLLNHQDAVVEEMTSRMGPFGNSGACNVNVNCPEGADWQTEKRSVALIVSGGYAACTGALVNNTANDGTPYFLTANHCLGSPNSWVYYFNHESSNCSGSTGPTNQSVSGGSLLVNNGGSDFALIELSSTPPASYNVEYAGWDNSGSTPSSAVGIHHPSGDVKKICFENNAPYQNSTGGAQVWWINQWELGVTEPGSSGSPLFDNNHRIIGQLYGGAAACSGSNNNGQYDFYGRFNVSWGLGASAYLDPLNTGVNTLDSYPTNAFDDEGCMNPTACNYDPDATSDNGSCLQNDVCGECGGGGESCSGCTYSTACNYNPEATVNDGSCDFFSCLVYGCMNVLACNYNPDATNDDWSCVYADVGYDCSGNCIQDLDEDGICDTCEEFDLMIVDCECEFFDPATYTVFITEVDEENCLIVEDCFCECNSDYDGDGVCDEHEFVGCSDPEACNYEPAATDEGVCDYESCSCSSDINGDGIVTVADILLILSEFGCMSSCESDVDGDGYVNVYDLLFLLSMFGEVC
jgi:hypothetical protein